MFGTGGGVSTVGSTAMGRVGAWVCGTGAPAGSDAKEPEGPPSAAGATTEGEASRVVVGSGAFNPEGAGLEEEAPPPGTASVAGRSWLDPAMPNASAPATTIAAGAAHFPTITPRMLDAPKVRARLTCPGTIVARDGPNNACGIFDAVLISDRDIRAEIDSQRIVLEPYDPAMVQPSSVDVRIDRFFRLFDNHKYAHIDPSEEQPELTRLVEVEGDEPFILHPGEFVLGSTYETVSLPDDIAARLEGKSSLGRLGLLTHSTAGFIDPGFSGHVTLELSNVATLPIKLWPGMKIGQLCFFRLTSAAEHPYGSGDYGNRYQGQRGPTASRSHLNFHRTSI